MHHRRPSLKQLCVTAACAAAFAPVFAEAAAYQYRANLQGLVVSGPGPSLDNLSVALATSQLPDAIVGVPYSVNLNQLLTVTGDASYSGGGITWGVVSNSLPEGLYLTADGYIGGTPTATGTGDIQVRASYKTAQGEQTYQVVSLPLTVALSGAALPAATVGSPYSYDFKSLVSSNDPTFTGAQASFSATGLPSGLSLAADGLLAGMPTVAVSSPGTSFNVKASFKSSQATQAYNLVVAPAPVVPGNSQYVLPGVYSFKVPANVYTVSAVLVGGGGGGGGGAAATSYNYGGGGGGGGGGLRYGNISVTPGETLTVLVGSAGVAGSYIAESRGSNGGAGGISSISRGSTALLSASGGNGGVGGGGSSNGQGAGGNGGTGSYTGGRGGSGASDRGGGGGGAAGYSGAGGLGGSGGAGYTGYGGGGGGGGFATSNTGVKAGNGGGVGIAGSGLAGAGGALGVVGQNGSYTALGAYGGGGGGGSGRASGGAGSTGAVRIIWGDGRSYPAQAN